jgi:hypothetical protein
MVKIYIYVQKGKEICYLKRVKGGKKRRAGGSGRGQAPISSVGINSRATDGKG